MRKTIRLTEDWVESEEVMFAGEYGGHTFVLTAEEYDNLMALRQAAEDYEKELRRIYAPVWAAERAERARVHEEMHRDARRATQLRHERKNAISRAKRRFRVSVYIIKHSGEI